MDRRCAPAAGLLVLGLALGVEGAAAQDVPQPVATERAEFARWLDQAPTSPYRAVAQIPVGPGITLGPAAADVPLAGVPSSRIEEKDGRLSIASGGTSRPLPRGRAITLGTHRLLAGGLPGQAVVTVFAPTGKPHPAPAHYPYAARWRYRVALTPAARPASERLLAPEGTEVIATDAGTVGLTVAGRPVTLRVFRIPAPGGEESELEIYFQDSTNGHGSYPAGRFVNLIPEAGGRYGLDFNRSRNPFCGYNTVFPCPAPWRGNRIPASVDAGETYRPGEP